MRIPLSKNPRAISVKILLRWEKDKPLLDEILFQVLTKSPLSDERDKALVGELVNGVVRHILYLDFLISKFSHVPLDEIDLEVRNLLRIGIYQILFTNIPERAVLAEILKILSQKGRASWIKGFVNAVLHKVVSEKEHLPEPEKNNFFYYLSIKYSFPLFLILRWFQRFGPEELEDLLKVSNGRAPLRVRVNTLKVSRENFLVYLQKEFLPEAEACLYSPTGIILKGFRGKITELKPYHFGWFSVQDSASQLVTFLLDPKPGERILDACAGVGGKATHIAEITQDKVDLYAFDLYPWRLEKLKENFQRLGLKRPKIFVGGVTELIKNFNPSFFDRILIDAPCSGTGIIRKHPDIKWARREEDFKQNQEKQLKLLTSLAPYLKKGGVLVYATCSLEPEENEEVIRLFLEKFPNFEVQEVKGLLKKIGGEVGDTLVDGPFMKTYPHRHNLDGFFCAVLRRIK